MLSPEVTCPPRKDNANEVPFCLCPSHFLLAILPLEIAFSSFSVMGLCVSVRKSFSPLLCATPGNEIRMPSCHTCQRFSILGPVVVHRSALPGFHQHKRVSHVHRWLWTCLAYFRKCFQCIFDWAWSLGLEFGFGVWDKAEGFTHFHFD